MIQTLIEMKRKLDPQPVAFQPSDVMDAWAKIDRILDKAQLDTHVDTAQRMFDQMLSRFRFTMEQRKSPLIAGMQDKINKAYGHVLVVKKV